MNHLTVQVLGPPIVQLAGKSITLKERKVLALLIYLAVTGQPQQRDSLATLFWSEQNQKRARANLRNTLWALRDTLGDEWLISEGDMIQLSPSPEFHLDWTEFTSLINTNKTQPFTSASLAGLETAVSTTSAAGDEQAAKNNINKARPSTVCFLNIVSNISISPFYSFGFANHIMRGGCRLCVGWLH
jgi:DNA-binding SARP family transcriptional activator